MAGKVQHEIPQLYQRGFLIPDTGKAERVFVFRRGGNSFPSNINRAGAESFFYSELADDGRRTLDDEITDYETHLGALVAHLRSLPAGAIADAGQAAEVVAHLTTRNAHLRGAFSYGFETIATGALEAFSEDNARRLLGIDGPIISDKFREHLAAALSNEPRVASLGIPPSLLECMAFTAIREGFSSNFGQWLPIAEAMLRKLANEASRLARDGHQKALAKSIAPDLRIKKLSIFRWTIVGVQTDLILPDCVAIAADMDGQFHPLMMAAHDEIEIVLVPLTSRTLMVATHGGENRFNVSDFNAAAASCSHVYFLSASRTPEIDNLTKLIGTRSVAVVDTAIGEGLQDLLAAKDVTKPQKTSVGLDQVPKPPRAITVTYVGNFSLEETHRISSALSDLIAEAAWTMPLDRLDGITFADDYPAALRALDRGMTNVSPPTTRQNQRLTGIAQSPNVIRDGVVKTHIIVHGDLGRTLLSNEENLKGLASSIIANQLAHAGFTQIFDETLPGVLLSPLTGGLDPILHSCAYPGWNAYFASRATAGFDEMRLKDTQEALLIALEEAFAEVPKARLAYRDHGDIDKLLAEALPRISFILEHAANLLGHADGVGQDPLEDATTLEAELQDRKLSAWLADYRCDLRYLWERRGEWTSYKEFLALTRHAQRLLWLFSIIPWLTSEGQCWIEVPLDVDLEALQLKDGT